jgi:ribosomal protein S18 acetylase RimI-like enzyme
MNVIQVQNKDELDILQGKQASFEKLKFEFSEKYIQSLKDNLDLKNSVQLIVKDGDIFCGYLSGYEHEFWPNFLYLRELFIDPNYQGQGIGSKLLTEFLEKAKKLNLKGAMTQTEFENISAQKLYEKIGFLKIENKEWNEGITYELVFDDGKK